MKDDAEFEQWYVENAHFLNSGEVGSRDYKLQRAAWRACAGRMRAPQLDEWIKWDGGECPVDGLVGVKFRDGSMASGYYAPDWNWAHYDNTGDIIAYRRVAS